MTAFTGIDTHKLLSEDAKSLEADVLQAHIDAAQELLEVDAENVKPEQMSRARLMMVHQVNWQVAMGEDGYYLKSRTVGPLSRQYRDATLLSPHAVAIRDDLFPPLTTSEADATGSDPLAGYLVIQRFR